MRVNRVAVAALSMAVLLTACGGTDTSGPEPTGAARSGEELFSQRILGSNAGCITCHSLDPDTRLVGPSIAGVAARAGSRVPGLRAEDYLRQSIVEPSAFVVDGFEDGKMPADWEEMLSPEEVEALVAYLLTLQ